MFIGIYWYNLGISKMNWNNGNRIELEKEF